MVWDRTRFEQFWGWEYRFEAYTPIAKRLRGYYAMPLLWKEHVIGWANVSVQGTALEVSCGYDAGAPPGGRAFKDALAEETEGLRAFLNLPGAGGRRRQENVRSLSLMRRLDQHDA